MLAVDATLQPVALRRRRELTPAQHARIRRQLILIPLYIWLVYGWWSVMAQLPFTGARATNLRDFAHFYVQGVIATEHDAHALYDIDAQATTLARVVPGGNVRYPPVYGPQVAVFFAPFGRLTYAHALYTWLAITALLYSGCAYLLWRHAPRLRSERGTAALLFLAAPTFHFVLGFSQAAAIGLIAVTLATLALQRDRKFLAGLAIGILAYKPPLGLALAFVFVLAGEWALVFGAIISAAAQIGLGCLYWGVGILGPYLAALTRLPEVAPAMEPFKFQMHSWRAFFQLLGLSDPLGGIVTLIATLITLVVALRTWRSDRPLPLRWASLLTATLLVDPHLYVYDLLLLVPALVLLWDWSLAGDARRRVTWLALVYTCYFAPLFGSVSLMTHVQLSVVVFAILMTMCAAWPPNTADTKSCEAPC